MIRLVAALLALGLMAVACGPESAVQEGGEAKDPVVLADVLPTPDGLTPDGDAEVADAAGLTGALLGRPDAEVTARLRERGLRSAAVRRWTGDRGGEMVVAVSVWPSHVTATSVGAQAIERDLGSGDLRAWTPRNAPGARGVRSDDRRELAAAVGPNSLVVRAAGPIPEDVVVRALSRLRTVAEGSAAAAGG